ncbi:type I-E CRISPR-associated protein Cas6/Cse3/CasE [Streptomyces sp. NPDC055105]|uniref:type I-E CRISPR-associated protein Cas6/Cse3/CasE n=1 Tax=Streptomyces sp. NPDC055105 TaxID=3365719 RepID=UPI0037D94CFD
MTTTAATGRLVATHSILTLDARHPLIAKSILSAHEMHRTVMSGFYGWVAPGDPAGPRGEMGILSTWTLDLKNNTVLLVVQSRVPPDWTAIPRAALIDKPTILPVDATLRAGDTYGFRITYNPTRARVIDKNGTPSRRTAHTTPHHAKQWLTQRLQQPGQPSIGDRGTLRIGATTDPDHIAVRMLPALIGTGPKAGLRVTRAEAKGILTVTDPHRFAETLSTGLGHAKAYSCGLLLIRATP